MTRHICIRDSEELDIASSIYVDLPAQLYFYWVIWWRHQMETFSALLAICAENSPVTGEFPAQRPMTQNFDVLFDLRLNKRLRKQSWGWWFETPSRPLWRCRNVFTRAYTHSAIIRNSRYVIFAHILQFYDKYPVVNGKKRCQQSAFILIIAIIQFLILIMINLLSNVWWQHICCNNRRTFVQACILPNLLVTIRFNGPDSQLLGVVYFGIY